MCTWREYAASANCKLTKRRLQIATEVPTATSQKTTHTTTAAMAGVGGCWSLPFLFFAETYLSFLVNLLVTIVCKPRGLRVVACTLRSRLAAALSCGAGNLAVKKRWLRIARRENCNPRFRSSCLLFPPAFPCFPQLFPAFPRCLRFPPLTGKTEKFAGKARHLVAIRKFC